MAAQTDADVDLDLAASVDSAIVWAPARCGNPQKEATTGEPKDYAISRSGGGLTMKIHLTADVCYPVFRRAHSPTSWLACTFPPGEDGPRPGQAVVLADKAYFSARSRAPRVDEKSQIQVLDRSQPVLPMMYGVPERRSHDTSGPAP